RRYAGPGVLFHKSHQEMIMPIEVSHLDIQASKFLKDRDARQLNKIPTFCGLCVYCLRDVCDLIKATIALVLCVVTSIFCAIWCVITYPCRAAKIIEPKEESPGYLTSPQIEGFTPREEESPLPTPRFGSLGINNRLYSGSLRRTI